MEIKWLLPFGSCSLLSSAPLPSKQRNRLLQMQSHTCSRAEIQVPDRILDGIIAQLRLPALGIQAAVLALLGARLGRIKGQGSTP